MMQNDEFRTVKKGLPPESSPQRSKLLFLAVFILVGIVWAIAILLFGVIDNFLFYTNDSSAQTVEISPIVYNSIQFFLQIFLYGVHFGILAFFISGIQTWILKNRLKSNFLIYIILSMIGGFAGGCVGGLLSYLLNYIVDDNFANVMNLLALGTSDVSWLVIRFLYFVEGAIVGVFIGLVAGVIIGLSQNWGMKNKKYSWGWFSYNVIVWVVISTVVGAINIGIGGFLGDALGAVFMMIGHGIGIICFLNFSPQFEFS